MAGKTEDEAEVTCVAPAGDRCGEGAIWSAGEKAVYWTDINRFLVHRYDTESASVRTWLFDEPCVALAQTSENGRLLLALGSKLIWWWPATDRRQDQGFRLSGWPRVRLNDGRADPLGNFWVGSMKNNVLPDGEPGEVAKGEGVLYRIAPDGAVTEWMSGIGISNTLCWTADKRTFYFGDTLENTIWAFDHDHETGAIGRRRSFFAGWNRGDPDGSSLDAEGTLWNCRYGGGCIGRVGPDGKLRGAVEVGVPNVTTCVFGGEDLRTLYITTAAAGTTGHRLAGSLFSIRTEAPGRPENKVRLG